MQLSWKYLKKMKISVAHEYFHAIQRSYKPNASENSDFLMELSSMWFEDIMVPDCNDYLSFVEMVNMDVEILMDDKNTKTDTLTSIAASNLPSNIDADKIKDAVDQKNIERTLDTLNLPGDAT